jgi:Pyridoxamine 5'-phosphate oxidase
MYTTPVDHLPMRWEAVEQQLRESGLYWVTGVGDEHPHPRPVWGVWADDVLHLSIGTPALRRQLAADPRVTVHLDSGTDVVIVEGTADVPVPTAIALIKTYEAKYDYAYDVEVYGPFTRILPSTIVAWRSAGYAGRDGFQESGKWRLHPA